MLSYLLSIAGPPARPESRASFPAPCVNTAEFDWWCGGLNGDGSMPHTFSAYSFMVRSEENSHMDEAALIVFAAHPRRSA